MSAEHVPPGGRGQGAAPLRLVVGHEERMKTIVSGVILALLAFHQVVADSKSVKNMTVRITGAVKAPGEHVLRSGATLTEAIDKAGGFADVFTSSNVRLFRFVGGFGDTTNTYVVMRWKAGPNSSGSDALLPTNTVQSIGDRDCISVNVPSVRKGRSADVTLKEGDWIAVRCESD